uniref:Uncharacterized protein n=1 Tax=Spironucleus salmonicida TaxID=348837 RepID=V6LYK8_9EUKA|eukprot:EST45904.1 Hypothetical protein SS50377_13879 [Spironucleus salmonicida]
MNISSYNNIYKNDTVFAKAIQYSEEKGKLIRKSKTRDQNCIWISCPERAYYSLASDGFDGYENLRIELIVLFRYSITGRFQASNVLQAPISLSTRRCLGCQQVLILGPTFLGMEAQYWTQCILLLNNTFGTMVVVSSYSSNTSSNSTLPFTYQYHIYLIYGQNLAKRICQMGSMVLPVGTQHACKNKWLGSLDIKVSAGFLMFALAGGEDSASWWSGSSEVAAITQFIESRVELMLAQDFHILVLRG